jgi:hypothetical protein
MKWTTVYLVAFGDRRQAVNESFWAEQARMEERLTVVVARLGGILVRAHSYKADEGHGFVSSPEEGRGIFAQIDPDAPVIALDATGQRAGSIHSGLTAHRGPILTVANWPAAWPGLAGMLSLKGSLARNGVTYSALWSETFDDDPFRDGLGRWIRTGILPRTMDHVRPLDRSELPTGARVVAAEIASDLLQMKSLIGVFGETDAGRDDAAIPDALLSRCGLLKTHISNETLLEAIAGVGEEEVRAVFRWYKTKGFTFCFGPDERTNLTALQVIWQCRMYVAACRLAAKYGCEAVGMRGPTFFEYVLPTWDLTGGTLNSTDRPPVGDALGVPIRPGKPIPHFDGEDECSGLDALLTHRVHAGLGQPLATASYSLRWGDWDRRHSPPIYVWVLRDSGGAPADHLVGGWGGADAPRQAPIYSPAGGGTLRGAAKPGEIIWSRVFIENGKLKMDLGRASAVALSHEETDRRRNGNLPQGAILHAVIHGISRDEMLARQKSDRIQVAYANSGEEADLALSAKGALAAELGLEVSLCGVEVASPQKGRVSRC